MVSVIFIISTTLAGAESFGIKFLGNSATTVSSSAGAVAITGWNNIATSTFTSGTILSSDGSVSATLSRSGAGAANIWHSGSAGDGGNGSLLDGYNDCQANSPSTSVVSGLRGSSYTVYVYTAGDVARPSNNGDWLPNYTVNGAEYYTATVDGSGAFRGLIQGGVSTTNNNIYPTTLTYGNYIEIDNVIPVNGAITISANSDNRTWRSPLNAIELVASSQAPIIKTPPGSLRLYTNGVAQFSVAVQGFPPIVFNWAKNGTNLADGGNISGAQSNILTVTNLTFADRGDYTVTVTNAFGSVTSPFVTLSVVYPTVADLEIDAFDKAYLVQTNGLIYYTQSLSNRVYDGTWTFSLDIQGAEDAFERTQSPQQEQLVNSLLTTWLVFNPPPWSWDGYNDDLGWFSLALARGYQMTSNADFLAQAEYGFNYAFGRGWDTNYNGGGIWEEQPTNVNGAPNKTPLACDSLLQTVCMLYQSTSNAVYLAEAGQIYSWVRTNLFNPNTGLVYGSISTNGIVNTTPNLYNQGTFVDCANLLHNITGQQVYYNDALLAVEFARNNLTVNAIFNNASTNLNTWAAEFGRGIGHFVSDNNLWSAYYPWMLANATAAWNCRRTDYNVSWSAWTEPTPTTLDITANWAVNAVAMMQATPASEPGLVNCTNQLRGTIIGTSGSWNNSGNTISYAFDGDLATFFDAPVATGAWVGIDFGAGVGNVIGQINYWPRTGYAERMAGGVFQGDTTPAFSNPVTLFSIATAPPDTNEVTPQTITNTNAFRCVRYLGPTNGWCDVAEIEFFSPNPPSSPTNLIAAVASDGQINLSWTPSGTTPWATTYVIQRGTNAGGPFTTIATGLTTTNFSDTGFTAGLTNYYVAAAVNGGGSSAISVEASAVIPAITFSWDGTSLTLNWLGNGLLVQATNVAGPWTSNVGATSPFIVSPAGAQMFYQVKTQ